MTAVPIVVTSTPDDYFVLYVRHDLNGTEVALPVLVKLGAAGTTTLTENVAALPKERYRVEKYRVADPADVDSDCIDDITELADPVGKNPVNPAAAIEFSDGAVAVPDRETFETLSRVGRGKLHLKVFLFDLDTDRPSVYIANTKTHPAHVVFLDTLGIEFEGNDRLRRGTITYHPELAASGGGKGVYVYRLPGPAVPFNFMARAYTVLAASLPLLDDNLALHFRDWELINFRDELSLYRESRIHLVFDEDLGSETSYLALNPGEGYGLLRSMAPGDRPNPRDVVIYEALPNDLPRVAGIVSTVPQTPLSHVNLRAVQDGIPNAFIRAALYNADIDNLLGSYVHYRVYNERATFRAATPAEVEAHYESSRPDEAQTPQRDLSVTAITPLSEIGFADWQAFGVKAANVAVLGTLGFPAGTVPDGFAVPFYFYDEFMKANGLYDDIKDMLADEAFQTDFKEQADELKELRKKIKDAESPQWIIDALTAMHATYPAGQSLRYRSSTNNEDLPGFSGAGLYDSKTQHPDETAEDGIDKSLKQVFASLWNFRAFTEREFHRIDHLAAAMGVLVHPNYSDEKVNGVAVSFDPFYGRDDAYYINSQIGEDLVTNPEALSVPEEVLLHPSGSYTVLASSNQAEPGQLLMSDAQLGQLRRHLEVIHAHFKGLYTPAPGEPFAMEIEFKITSDNILAIKQARPWVFSAFGGSNSDGSDDGGSGPPGPGGGPGGGSGGGGSGGGGGGSRDQHGNTAAQAFAIPPSGRTLGQINPARDVDYFTLTAPRSGVLVVETTGFTATRGTVWQDGIELATADSGGERQNFRLSTRVTAGPVVVAVRGNGRQTGSYALQTALVQGYLGNPGAYSFQSGIGLLSGWVCDADVVELEINGAQRVVAAYGTDRADTESTAAGEELCGDTDNGFGVLFNWNLLGDGVHTVVALADGVAFDQATFTVTTLGEEFVTDAVGETVLADFPTAGAAVRLVWQQANQNFMLAPLGGEPPSASPPSPAGGPTGALENPGPASFQSGLGLLSGWVCNAEEVELEINGGGRIAAAYGTARGDTVSVCGDQNNGFGLLFNWNLLGDGVHTTVALADGEEFGRATFTVTTLGVEFLQGMQGETVVADFPSPGEAVRLVWQQDSQNFMLAPLP